MCLILTNSRTDLSAYFGGLNVVSPVGWVVNFAKSLYKLLILISTAYQFSKTVLPIFCGQDHLLDGQFWQWFYIVGKIIY